MKRYLMLLLAVIPILALPAASAADMYRWTDKSGVVHFSTEPGDSSAQRLTDTDLAPVRETGGNPAADSTGGTKSVLPGEITADGRLLFNGRPLSDVTAAPAVFRLYSREVKQWLTPAYTYDPGSGNFRITGLAAGTYTGEVKVEAEPANPDQYPGDYKGRFSLNAAPQRPAPINVDMELLMHLTSPEDNAAPLANWGAVCSNKVEFETPVPIAWDAVGKDAAYRYSIVRTVCQPFEFKETVAADRTAASRIVLELPPNKDGEFYTLRLEARKDDRLVGSLMTHGTNGWGWDYRFRVLPKRGPTRVISPVRD